MSKGPTPEELRRLRKLRRQQEQEASGRAAATLTEDDVAQGRPQPMIKFEELPAAVDSPDAQGPLTAEEEVTWELCQRSFAQYKEAWFVAAGALDISLRGRLWRRDYDTAEAFIRDVADMSTSNAYRQIAGARIAALLADPPRLELESNDQSRMRDSGNVQAYVISQRAAESLTPIREDYGDDAAAEAYRTVAEATGRDKVSQKTITGIVKQFPRKAAEELDTEQRRERLHALAVQQAAAEAAAKAQPAGPVAAFAAYVATAEAFAAKTDGLAAAYAAAAATDPVEAKRLAVRLRDHLTVVVDNLPDV
ncbi:hypothetical protein GCM10010260_83710 [Streptomyces filipinensis]|uniref:Uncharacterized protein n=1 Tax=Streptomyces filipinensis TaxID=66887 RepID=A0A918IKH1_9ACTN|nr:hypothetical protein [Streptomyces filipinensis]GGV30475.1 hypothetical protein GCM10010260_83710 [Streptomyces filipinensis]